MQPDENPTATGDLSGNSKSEKRRTSQEPERSGLLQGVQKPLGLRGHANGLHSLEDRKLQSRAHHEVSKAIMKGKLVRPKKCEQCGKEPGDDIGGRSKIVAHHHNGYENQLDVQWLCQRCNIRLGLIRDPREPEPAPPAISILEGGDPWPPPADWAEDKRLRNLWWYGKEGY